MNGATATLHLYELADAHRSLFDRIEELDGELTPELEAELDLLFPSLERKIDGCLSVFSEKLRTADALSAEIGRLQALKRSQENAAERLKAYVKNSLIRAGIDKVQTARFVARVQNSPPSAQWNGDPAEAPEAFRRVKVEFDSRAALAAFKNGESLPDRVEIRQGRHLVIW